MSIVAAVVTKLPPPDHFASIGWILVGLGALLFIANNALTFWKDHMKEKPTPSETYLTLQAFDDHKNERKGDVKEIKDLIRDLGDKLEKSKVYQAKARQRIHKRMNAHENALYFMAGEAKADGNVHASRVIMERLAHGLSEENDDE